MKFTFTIYRQSWSISSHLAWHSSPLYLNKFWLGEKEHESFLLSLTNKNSTEHTSTSLTILFVSWQLDEYCCFPGVLSEWSTDIPAGHPGGDVLSPAEGVFPGTAGSELLDYTATLPQSASIWDLSEEILSSHRRSWGHVEGSLASPHS